MFFHTIPRSLGLQIRSLIRERYPDWSYSFKYQGQSIIISIQSGNEVDLNALVAEVTNYPDLTVIYWAEVTALRTDAKPVQVKRGNLIGWCYATPTMTDRMKAGTTKVGDKVLVCFADGDRNLPVVFG